MFVCLALMLGVSLADLPPLAAEVESEARELILQTAVTPALIADIGEFSADAERLSASLREAGVEQDLPSIFHGIAEDARARASELQSADTPAERAEAFTNLRVLLEDAILIAPMAAGAAADMAQREADVAVR